MITAAQARAQAEKKNPDAIVRFILTEIDKLSKEGKMKFITRDFGFSDSSLYGGKPNEGQQSVLNKLESLGYTCTIWAQERQFVDVWLEVSWENAA